MDALIGGLLSFAIGAVDWTLALSMLGLLDD